MCSWKISDKQTNKHTLDSRERWDSTWTEYLGSVHANTAKSWSRIKHCWFVRKQVKFDFPHSKHTQLTGNQHESSNLINVNQFLMGTWILQHILMNINESPVLFFYFSTHCRNHIFPCAIKCLPILKGKWRLAVSWFNRLDLHLW